MCFRFLQVTWAFWRTGELPRHDHTYVEGVDAEAPLVGETFAEGEKREHAQMGETDKEWAKGGPHWPAEGAKDRKDGDGQP